MSPVSIRSSDCRRAILVIACVVLCRTLATGANFLDISSEDAASNIDTYFQAADTAIVKSDIRTANQKISFIEFNVQKYGELFSKDQKKAFGDRIAALKGTVRHVADSLVQVNLSILKSQGRGEAIKFRQECAARGLTEMQLAPVDNAIVDASPSSDNAPALAPDASPAESAPVEKQQRKAPAAPLDDILTGEIKFPEEKPAPQPRPSPEPAAAKSQKTVPDFQEPAPPAPASSPPAREIWPESAPSPAPVEAAREPGPVQRKKSADSVSARIAELRDGKKFDEAMTLLQVHRPQLQKFLSVRTYEKLKNSVETANTNDQNNRESAVKLAKEIDNLVEQDQSLEAHNRFDARRDFFKHYLDAERFDGLEKTVGAASVAFGQAQAKAAARCREIRTLLAENIVEAAAAFDRSKDELKQYLRKETFEQLRKDIADAVASMRDKTRQSQLVKREIQGLVEKRKGDAALASFAKNRPLLKDCLDTGSFSKLSAAALQAANDFALRQAKAHTAARVLDSLLAAKRIEQAYDKLSACKDTLRLGLNDDKRFFEIKDRVLTAYDDFTTKKKKTEKTVRKINTYIDHKEGREAKAAFLLDGALLKEFLERGAYSKLESTVRTSAAEWDASVAAARKTVTEIESDLAKRRIEPAYTTFKKSRDMFSRYLENDSAVETLGKKTDKALSDYRKHKRWADDMIHELHVFIDHNQGNLAVSHLTKVRPELSLYVEAGVLSSLDSAATRANSEFIASTKLADKNALRVRGLLKKKRCEEAYTVFQDLRPSLEQYMIDTAFSALSNEVNGAYAELKEKKKKAEEFAEELKGLVADHKQKEARKRFTENRQTLKQYLEPAAFSALEKLVMTSPKKQ